MKFCIFFPPSLANLPAYGSDSSAASDLANVPALYWLSGLTCTEDNFVQKAGAFRAAAAANIALICPDTSPRGANLGPEEKASWDFGEGAGFYLNATTDLYKNNYRMADYVVHELPALIAAAGLHIDAVSNRSVFGHSAGGHGALVSFLRPENKGLFRSVSAFSPIAHPSACPWGHKAFTGYLQSKEEWAQWDATALAAAYDGPATELLIDQGGADEWLEKKQLLPHDLIAAVEQRKDKTLTVKYRQREGYDHSYFFIQTFVDEHIHFHAKALHKQ